MRDTEFQSQDSATLPHVHGRKTRAPPKHADLQNVFDTGRSIPETEDPRGGQPACGPRAQSCLYSSPWWRLVMALQRSRRTAHCCAARTFAFHLPGLVLASQLQAAHAVCQVARVRPLSVCCHSHSTEEATLDSQLCSQWARAQSSLVSRARQESRYRSLCTCRYVLAEGMPSRAKTQSVPKCQACVVV